ncbi:MAG: holo-ACP synthase [Acidobacteria bacterium]|nr:holo-ACP synthase [Acidobacteriota bacterium]
MIVGLGTDVSEVARIAAAIARRGERLLRRVFTPEEIAFCRGRRRPAEHFAARFAAKEAVFKALGTGRALGVRWTDVEVRREPAGRPSVRLAGGARRRAESLGAERVWVSLASAGDRAWAVAVLESGSD